MAPRRGLSTCTQDYGLSICAQDYSMENALMLAGQAACLEPSPNLQFRSPHHVAPPLPSMKFSLLVELLLNGTQCSLRRARRHAHFARRHTCARRTLLEENKGSRRFKSVSS